jgi:hypothetical protein
MMSNWTAKPTSPQQPVRRVRDEVRDGVAVVLTSALASTLLAVVATVVMKLAG